jgi:hypothetical protein
VLISIGACKDKTIPEQWAVLGVPAKGLVEVQDKTDANGFYADYEGYDLKGLMNAVDGELRRRGYAPACTAFEGNVRGFTKDSSRLAMKVDQFAETTVLSLFDQHGSEPMLFGVCFGEMTAEPKQGSE